MPSAKEEESSKNIDIQSSVGTSSQDPNPVSSTAAIPVAHASKPGDADIDRKSATAAVPADGCKRWPGIHYCN